MNDWDINNKIIDDLINVISNKELAYLVFKNEFKYQMAHTSCATLKNMNLVAKKYRESYSNMKTNEDKISLLFSILQGLFVAIDSLYTIGKTTTTNKIFLNVNQNQELRGIKHIRNDVVGHPSYRYFSDSIGFSTLDLDHINDNVFNYLTYKNEKEKIVVEEKKVDLLKVIDSYYCECNNILKSTLQFFDLRNRHEDIDISSMVSLLSFRFMDRNLDDDLLTKIENQYYGYFPNNKTNRLLWRTKNIRILFEYEPKNKYIDYLTIVEIYKLYCLVYQVEKENSKKLSFKFVKYTRNKEFRTLSRKIKNIKMNNFKINILHDSKHPLYYEHMELIISRFRKDRNVKNLVAWIKEQVEIGNPDMLYLIGSELKN